MIEPTEKDIGKLVVYRKDETDEEFGRLTKIIDEKDVFVKYNGDNISKCARRQKNEGKNIWRLFDGELAKR